MPAFFSKFTPLFTGVRVSSWQRSTVVFGALVLLGMLAAALLAIDGYLFYRSHLQRDMPATPLRNNPLLTEQAIDTALNLFNAREEKMRAVLRGE